MNTQDIIKNLISVGMTQKRIADNVDCTQAAVSIWLSGRCEANAKYYLRLKDLYGEKTKQIEVKSVVAD